jgi:transposase
MSKESMSDELWEIIEPLLPEEPPKPKGGRPRVEDRAALGGIIFVLKSGIPWEMLPQGMGCGSGSTCSGGACATGRRRARGKICTGCSWIVWARPTG